MNLVIHPEPKESFLWSLKKGGGLVIRKKYVSENSAAKFSSENTFQIQHGYNIGDGQW